jgi:hypothetical protein
MLFTNLWNKSTCTQTPAFPTWQELPLPKVGVIAWEKYLAFITRKYIGLSLLVKSQERELRSFFTFEYPNVQLITI